MKPAEAAWVRDHAWLKPMAREYREHPGYYERCLCQVGASWFCSNDRHGSCHRAEPGPPTNETWVLDVRGNPMFFREHHAHPTETITGRRYLRDAHVWLADRACRWTCSCACHAKPGPTFETLTLPGLEPIGAAS
jgi:hypothetical protein